MDKFEISKSSEVKTLILTPLEDLEVWAKDFCETDGFNKALSMVKKVAFRSYVKPKDAVKVLTKLMVRCDRMMAETDLKWVEDYEKCFYCRYIRCVHEDGYIGHDITINIVLHGQFAAG